MNHGHVRPNPEGLVARCGGPAICPDCKNELLYAFRTYKSIVEKVRSMKAVYRSNEDFKDLFDEVDKLDRIETPNA